MLIEAIADGIRTAPLPGDPFTGSTYELREKVPQGTRHPHAAQVARQAMAELDSDVVVRGALGDHIYHAFRDAKTAEYERYRRAVHPWEHEAYLRIY